MKKFFKAILLLSFLCFSCQIQAQKKEFEKDETQSLSYYWELESKTRKGTFAIKPYKAMYILPLRWTNRPNEIPTSLNPENVATEYNNYNNFETRFQMSLKTKVATGLFFGEGDIWLGFTQTANWQVLNVPLSRPFRELNYEPEIIFNFPISSDIHFFGIQAKMVGIALNHQSNGKSLPYSRSWNRVVFHVGFEYNNLNFIIRPWFRFSERFAKDDNPKIDDYIGVGDATFKYSYKQQTFSLMLRSNMRLNRHLKGYADFSWSYPISGNLKATLHMTHGYGETLIDYNHKQTTIGLGISLIEWF